MADGAIILDNAETDIRLDFLNTNSVPYVLVGQTNNPSSNWVDLDNYNVGLVGCRFLVEKGYKRIAFMLGQDQYHVNLLRADGFRQIADECGIDYTIEYNIDSMETAYHKTLDLCRQDPYDALFISGSERAVGAYRALSEIGLKIPEDVAILGVDNIDLCHYLYPSMSVIDQNCDVLAHNIIEILDNLIHGKKGESKRQLLIQNKIIEREST